MKKKNNISTAIFKTLVYSDVFGSPLILSDLHKYLYRYKIGKDELRLFLTASSFVQKIGNYYVLSGREKLVEKHRPKVKESERKKKIAEDVIEKISKIPSVLLMGISGSVATHSATKEADIDLFIITRDHTLWVTRLLVTGMLFILRKKRSVRVQIAPDTVCTNMWMTESNLVLTKKNLFIAREIVQMQVIFDRYYTYARFLQANAWIYRYFPNMDRPTVFSAKSYFPTFALSLLNLAAYFIQKLYMQNKKTTEIVSLHFAAFHPKDITHAALHTYTNRLRTYTLYNGEKKRVSQDRRHITPGS